MNIDTGELRRFADDESKPPNYVRVPESVKEVYRQAMKELENSDSAQIDLSGKSPLAEFAKMERKKRDREKKKRKVSSQSRKKNRRG